MSEEKKVKVVARNGFELIYGELIEMTPWGAPRIRVTDLFWKRRGVRDGSFQEDGVSGMLFGVVVYVWVPYEEFTEVWESLEPGTVTTKIASNDLRDAGEFKSAEEMRKKYKEHVARGIRWNCL